MIYSLGLYDFNLAVTSTCILPDNTAILFSNIETEFWSVEVVIYCLFDFKLCTRHGHTSNNCDCILYNRLYLKIGQYCCNLWATHFKYNDVTCSISVDPFRTDFTIYWFPASLIGTTSHKLQGEAPRRRGYRTEKFASTIGFKESKDHY